MDSMNPFSSRTTGHFPVSIATSLAFEVAMGTGTAPEGAETTEMRLDKYTEIWINLRTVFRNLYNSVSTEVKRSAVADEIVDALITEVESIRKIVAEIPNPPKCVFYLCNYKDLGSRFLGAKPREDKTLNQQQYTELSRKSFHLYLKEHGNSSDHLLFPNGPRPDTRKGKFVMLTNYTYDLLSWKSFEDLTLLESHTGALKDKSQWYTKLYNGKEYPNLPLHPIVYGVFGDDTLLSPMNASIKNTLLEIAKADKWTPLSSNDLVRHSVSKMKDKYSSQILLGFR
ncbi:MAG: hypothetical protein E6Q68_00900 [Polynucleobacter sp.]|nr:MAG: hypothetical protein E6Q68_00900 [Polynucleobacter sp.]